MDNKLSKFLIGFCAALAVLSGALGMKFREELKKTEKLRADLAKSLISAEKVERMIDLQKENEKKRLEKLEIADRAKPGSKTETITKSVMVPGKVVTQTSSGSTRSS